MIEEPEGALRRAGGAGLIGRYQLEAAIFSSRIRHTRSIGDWSSDVCSSDLTSITVVALSNSAPSLLTVPSSVSVAANATSATFTASTGALLSDQAATLTATLNGSSAPATLSLVAPVTLSALQCAAASLASNASTTCTVTLSKSATSSTVVTLSNSAL